jgi:hypothetical protein
MLGVVAVEEYNRRVAHAMERAQRALGLRSAEAFARALSDRVGGAPAGSTYRRWLQEQQVVPGWALVAAGELTGMGLDALMGNVTVSAGSQSELAAQVGELRREVEALQRQVADLQVASMDRESAQPAPQEEKERGRRHAYGA